jgi:argininosuccinate lyase
MATLWNKGTEALQDVARFTVGNDTNWDMRLAPYDVKGSRAHVKMLGRIDRKSVV